MAFEILKIAIASFFGSFGFGALLHAPKESLPIGSAIGALGYVGYWLLCQAGVAEALAMFLGAFVASAAGQIAARKMKRISTIFVTVAILPLVPGLGLYRAMSALGQGNLSLGGSIAVESMTLILAIALGVGVGSAFFSTRRIQPMRCDTNETEENADDKHS